MCKFHEVHVRRGYAIDGPPPPPVMHICMRAHEQYTIAVHRFRHLLSCKISCEVCQTAPFVTTVMVPSWESTIKKTSIDHLFYAIRVRQGVDITRNHSTFTQNR